MKNKSLSKKDHLLSLQDKRTELLKEQGGVVEGQISDDHPQMRSIRVMENRLDKAMIKYNEAMSIKKTYDLILKRLKEERIGYDNQLTAIEESLKGKAQDIQELVSLSVDANFSKEQAEADLRKYQIASANKPVGNESRLFPMMASEPSITILKPPSRDDQQDGKLSQTSIVASKLNDESQVPNLDIKSMSTNKENQAKNRLKEYESAIKKIKDATGVTDINEIVKKFATQQETLK